MSVEALLGDANGTDGVFVAVRVQNGGCQSSNAKGLFFFLYPQNQQYMLSLDLGKTTCFFFPISDTGAFIISGV